ncbi:TetR/AcrR family transcriptional regulator [Ferrovibrio sp.]|uniref:TetR/AcrR family transcriptional regulator n=1 Tax=Ferrovibrio sp. TaxID=1917215 RepID=UPI001B3CB05A|nr:TetR/AcrR family transcriptional regulator [Ferrovibrio sp.]MBP7063864.1 TetR/AcrR family transcriptional regulator [Ferrovibrio sp.]
MTKTATRKRASRLPREKREADILAAARAVFRLRGYENASISEIAERAGVVEGSIYRYFESKRALLVRVIEDWYSGMIEEDSHLLPSVSGIRNRLRYIVWHHLKALHDEPGLSSLVFLEFRPDPNYRKTTIYALNRRYTARATAVIRDAVAAGEFRNDVSPGLVRDLIYGCVEHHTWAFLRGEGDFDIEAVADSITDVVYRGLAAPAPQPQPLDVALQRLDAAVSQLNKLSLAAPTEEGLQNIERGRRRR